MSSFRDLGGEPRLREVVVVEVDAEHALGPAPLHLDRIEAGIAADVEHGSAGEIGRDRVGESPPFDSGIVAQEVVGRRFDPGKLDVVEPRPERFDRLANLVERDIRIGIIPASRSLQLGPQARPAGRAWPTASQAVLLAGGTRPPGNR